MFTALMCAACTSKKTTPRGPGPIVDLATDVEGLSGLTRDEHGMLWAAGEQGDFVLKTDPRNHAVVVYPVTGCPDGVDLEGLTSLGGGRFAVGTETQESGRTRDVLVFGEVRGDAFVLGTAERCDYGLWKMSAPRNHGIEGVCRTDGKLVLATELIDERSGERWAPIAVYDLSSRTWSAYLLRLSSATGKLAAIDCRIVDGAIVALAVERHFGVARLLRFTVPKESSSRIEPDAVVDLSKHIEPLPNFEGLVWDADDTVILLTDNRYRGRAEEASRMYYVPSSIVP